MITFWVIVSFFLSSVAFGQVVLDEQTFQKALTKEIQRHENGEWLYQRSDVFRNSILRSVNKCLGLVRPTVDAQQEQRTLYSGDISNDAFGQDETSVAISRSNENLIAVGSNDEVEDVRSMPLYLSINGGKTWNTSHMPAAPKPYYAYGDPVLAADQFGGFYYAYLIGNDHERLSNILVAHSADGLTWTYGDPIMANVIAGKSSEDKESIAVDMGSNSPTFGRVYITWMHYSSDSSETGLHLTWSDNLGQSWSEPIRLDYGTGFFSQIKIDKNGAIFVTYSGYRDDGGISQHFLLRSYNHGKSFTRKVISDFLNYPYSTKQHVPVLKGASGIRGFPYVTSDYDANHNLLHVVYGSYVTWKNGSSSAMLFYTSTSNGGDSWQEPMAIGFNGDSTSLQTDRFLPWLASDPRTGSVRVVYYSSEKDPANIKTVALRVIIDSTRRTNYKILSDSLFDPLKVNNYTLTPFLGDYNGCAFSGSTFAAAWTEDRKGSPDGEIYAYISQAESGVSQIHQVSSKTLSIYSVYPNPAGKGKLSIGFALPKSGFISLQLTSSNGGSAEQLFDGELGSGTYERSFDLGALPSGNYTISLSTDYGIAHKEIIVVH